MLLQAHLVPASLNVMTLSERVLHDVYASEAGASLISLVIRHRRRTDVQKLAEPWYHNQITPIASVSDDT